jgi:hypothetical protein
MDKRCPFCHQNIPVFQFDAHVAQHTKLRDDGQMTDHVTVAPEDRFQGNLEQVPQWYCHERCGAVTGMPEEIIRSYLADPFLYNDYTFCTGCQKYPHQSEFHWVETGENLHAYNRRLRMEYIQRHGLDPKDFVWVKGTPERRKRKWSGVVLLVGCLAVAVVALGLFGVAAAGAALFRKASAPSPAFAPPTAPTFTVDPNYSTTPFAGDSGFPNSAFDTQQQIDDIHRRIQQQQEDIRRQHEQIRQQHEEMMKSLRGQ